MEKYRGKIFNEQVFEKYLKTLPSTKENSLIKNGLFDQKYINNMNDFFELKDQNNSNRIYKILHK